MRRYHITVVIVAIVVIIVAALSFWPKFNYRLEWALAPIQQQERTRELEQKIEEDKKRLGKKMAEIAEQKRKASAARNEEANRRSRQLIQQQGRKTIEDARRWSEQLAP